MLVTFQTSLAQLAADAYGVSEYSGATLAGTLSVDKVVALYVSGGRDSVAEMLFWSVQHKEGVLVIIDSLCVAPAHANRHQRRILPTPPSAPRGAAVSFDFRGSRGGYLTSSVSSSGGSTGP
jgi:hypothetical protein